MIDRSNSATDCPHLVSREHGRPIGVWHKRKRVEDGAYRRGHLDLMDLILLEWMMEEIRDWIFLVFFCFRILEAQNIEVGRAQKAEESSGAFQLGAHKRRVYRGAVRERRATRPRLILESGELGQQEQGEHIAGPKFGRVKRREHARQQCICVVRSGDREVQQHPGEQIPVVWVHAGEVRHSAHHPFAQFQRLTKKSFHFFPIDS